MRTIFNKAWQVIVWLGPPSLTSQLAQALKTWLHWHEIVGRDGELNAKYKLGPPEKRQPGEEVVKLRVARQEVARTLHQCAWVSRTWIRQEIQAARRISIPSSFAEILTWDNLANVADEYYTLASPDPAHFPVGEQGWNEVPAFSRDLLYNPLTLIYYIQTPRVRPILLGNVQYNHLTEWIMSMAPFETTEQVDKVYGVLGLFEPVLTLGEEVNVSVLEVDYKASTTSVYVEMMKRILLQSRNLVWLESHVYSPNAENQSHLPIWVYNWDAPNFDVLMTKHTESLWQVSVRNAGTKTRKFETKMTSANFSKLTADIHGIDSLCAWTIRGFRCKTITKVYPAGHGFAQLSLLPATL
jgi:hypothetical protein